MSEIPETPTAAARSLIGWFAGGLAFQSVENLHASYLVSTLYGLGAVIVAIIDFKLPALLSRSPQLTKTLNQVSADARWWVGVAFVTLIILALSPYVQERRWPFRASIEAPPSRPADVVINPQQQPQLPKKFYSESDKSRLAEVTYALSKELTEKGIKAVDAAFELGRLWEGQNGPNAGKFGPEALATKLKEAQDLLVQSEKDIGSIVSQNEGAYREELRSVLGGDRAHGESVQRFSEALEVVAAHIEAFSISHRGVAASVDAYSVDAAILRSMPQCIEIMRQRGTTFGNWVNDARKRVAALREILNR